MWMKKSFGKADKELKLTRFEKFDAPFESAYVHAGDIHVPGDWTGGDLLRACGHDPGSRYLGACTMFVVDGDLTVDGTLDLDAGVNESIGLSVTGRLHAGVVDVDATMLFVFGGAEVKQLINFTTTDGTISIAGTTECPLVIYDEGDLNLASTGHILCRRYDGPAEAPALGDASEDNDEDLGWGWPRITLTRTEVPDALVEGLYDEHHRVDSRLALALARAGKPLLRPAYVRHA